MKYNKLFLIGMLIVTSGNMHGEFRPHIYARLYDGENNFYPHVNAFIFTRLNLSNDEKNINELASFLIPEKREVLEKIVEDTIPNTKLKSIQAPLLGKIEITKQTLAKAVAFTGLMFLDWNRNFIDEKVSLVKKKASANSEQQHAAVKAGLQLQPSALRQQNLTVAEKSKAGFIAAKDVAKNVGYDLTKEFMIQKLRAQLDPHLNKIMRCIPMPNTVKNHSYFAVVRYISNKSINGTLGLAYDAAYIGIKKQALSLAKP